MLRTLPNSSLTLLLLLLAFGQGMAQTPAQPPKPLTLKQVWTLDVTYTDHQHGVTFRYPSTWQATTQFAYNPPALTLSGPPPIAGFGYSEGSFPRDRIVGPYSGTNLEGVGIVYSAVSPTSSAECEAKAASLPDSPRNSQVIFGHRSFSVYKTGEGGMSQPIEGKLYVTHEGSTCYLLETDLAVLSSGMDHIQTLTSAQLRYIDIHLLGIIKSVRIVPKRD
jgi:hypothetical protein